MTEDAPSFEEFAQRMGAKPRGQCGVCELPDEVRAELARAHEMGFRSTIMASYLREAGYDVGIGALENHAKRNHAW